MDEQTSLKPTRKYTTISISHEIKKELESIIYSSGRAQKYDDLFREMIADKKAKINAAANKAVSTITKDKPEVV
jgi:ribosomal protein S3AE